MNWDLWYIPEIDYLFVSFLGTRYLNKAVVKKHGLDKVMDMDFYYIGRV